MISGCFNGVPLRCTRRKTGYTQRRHRDPWRFFEVVAMQEIMSCMGAERLGSEEMAGFLLFFPINLLEISCTI
jgi:hypothetical protein